MYNSLIVRVLCRYVSWYIPVYITNNSCIISGIIIVYEWIIHNYMVAPPDAAASGAVPIRLKLSHLVLLLRFLPSSCQNMSISRFEHISSFYSCMAAPGSCSRKFQLMKQNQKNTPISEMVDLRVSPLSWFHNWNFRFPIEFKINHRGFMLDLV